MDEAKDGGVSWRVQVKSKLWAMGIGVIDPCDKPSIGYEEDADLHAQINEAKAKGDFDTVVNLLKPIVGSDLRSVHKSDFLILYIDKDIFMFGTTVEFAWAIQQRKPVLIVCKQGKKAIPGFAFGMMPPDMMFNNFDEMFNYLNFVDTAANFDDKRRWHFFDYDKIFGRRK